MVEEFEVTLGRLISPSIVLSIYLLLFVIFYTWTLTFSTAISLGLIVAFPLILLVIRPTWQRLSLFTKLKRNHFFEMLVVVTLSLVAFIAVQYLPFVAGTSAFQMIFLGLSPVFIHSLISFSADLKLVDSKEGDV
jgi:hypothetical protein